MINRFGRPEDVAGVVSYLASADGDFVTGQTVSFQKVSCVDLTVRLVLMGGGLWGRSLVVKKCINFFTLVVKFSHGDLYALTI